MNEVIEITVPVRIVSEMNSREHWRKRHARFKAHKHAAHCGLAAHRTTLRSIADGDVAVTITRIGKRRLDSDNLASGAKGLRDQIAAELGIDDGSQRITWTYQQQIGREYAAVIRIERKA